MPITSLEDRDPSTITTLDPIEPFSTQPADVTRETPKKNGKTVMAAVVFSLAFAVVGCGSSSPNDEPTNEFNVSAIDNRLAFATVADYQRVVDNPTEEVVQKFSRTVDGFDFAPLKSRASLVDNGAGSAIADTHLANILNKDMVVQIGPNLFRVNPLAEKVYVLPAAYAKEYTSLLAEDEKNPHISVYSTSDDVLALVANGASQSEGTISSQLLCSETGIGGRHVSEFLSDLNGTLAYADYDRYGIYFKLSASIYPIQNGSGYQFDFTNLTGLDHIYYHVRCGVTRDYAMVTAGDYSGSKQSYTAYSGTSSLNEVYFYYRLKNTNIAPPANQYVTPVFGFRVNF